MKDMSHVLAVHNRHNRVARYRPCLHRRLVYHQQSGSPHPSVVYPISSREACSVMRWLSQWRLKEWVYALDADIGARAKKEEKRRVPGRHSVSPEFVTGNMKHQAYLVCNCTRRSQHAVSSPLERTHTVFGRRHISSCSVLPPGESATQHRPRCRPAVPRTASMPGHIEFWYSPK
jgi:hypothetical protein